MRRQSKSHLPPTAIRPIVAQNVVTLRDRKYADLEKVTARNRALARDAGTTLSQIQRTVEMKVGTSIDLIERLAHALGVRAPDLLTQSFASTVTVTPRAPMSAAGEGLQRRPG